MLLQGAVQCAGGMGGLKWHNIAVPQGTTTPTISMSAPLSSHRLSSQAASLCGMEGDASKLFSVSQVMLHSEEFINKHIYFSYMQIGRPESRVSRIPYMLKYV